MTTREPSDADTASTSATGAPPGDAPATGARFPDTGAEGVSSVLLDRTLPLRRLVLRTFIRRYLIAATIVTVVAYANLYYQARVDFDALRTREAAQVEIAAQLLTRDFESVSADLMVLALSPQARRYVESGAAADKHQLTELFVNMSAEKRFYDQIRLLDAGGMEVVRVNLGDGGPRIVPESELQPKGGRYFFRDSIRLSPGEVYVSPFDLNVERGEIERPFKPMLRFGTPLFDRSGERRGVVLINLLGQVLIDDFHKALRESPSPMLINRDGYWLSHPDARDEWGFMFGSERTFAKLHPAAWARFGETDGGSFETEDGLYSFATVYPLQASQHSSVGSAQPEGPPTPAIGHRDYFWQIVSLVPADALPSASLFHSARTATFYLLLLGLLAVLVAYSAINTATRRRWQRTASESERQLKEITSTLGEGVYVMDRDGLITFVNPEAQRLLGWNARELLGENAHELFHQDRDAPGGPPGAGCPIRRVAETGEVFRGEQSFWRKDGTEVDVEVTASPIVRAGKAEGTVVSFRDIGHRKKNEEKIRQLAYYDTLTGLPNRRLLIDRLDQAMAQARRYGRTLAILFLDLDRFKTVNDTLGHEAGDELLKIVAGRLEACVRRGDTVARPAGDEFVILLPELTRSADAAFVAEKILAALGQPVTLRGAELTATASIGIALFEPGCNDDMQELMKKADIAMYEVKAGGRNAYRFYQEAPEGRTPAPRVDERFSGE